MMSAEQRYIILNTHSDDDHQCATTGYDTTLPRDEGGYILIIFNPVVDNLNLTQCMYSCIGVYSYILVYDFGRKRRGGVETLYRRIA